MIVREIRPARYTRGDVKKAHEALNELFDAIGLTYREYEELSEAEFDKLDSKVTDKIEWLRTVEVGAFKKTEKGAQVYSYVIRFTFAKTNFTELSEVAKKLADYLDTHYWQHLHFWDNPDGSQRFSCIPSSGTEVPRIFNRLSFRPGRGFIVKMVANEAHKKLDEIKEQLKQLRPSLGDQLKGRMIESGTNPATGSSS
jgi:hypothetical protein